MANITNKIVDSVISSLEKMKSPDKSISSFWSYLKEQLYSESTWDQNDLAIIEKEILKELNKLNQNDLVKIWKLSEAAESKLEETTNINPEEMKSDLVSEFLSKVMDRMDDSYTRGGSYAPSFVPNRSGAKEDDDSENEIVDDEQFVENEMDEDFDDDEFFDDDSFDEDEEENF